MADVSSTLPAWSVTPGSNLPADANTIGAGLADNFQEIQAVVRSWLANKGADIASATTTDLGAVAGLFHDITGTITITGFGTIGAGIWKILQFDGALILTHNATSLILPGAANITTAAGDMLMATSEGSGNWRVNWFTKAATGSTPPFVDSTAIIKGSADATKLLRLEVDGFTTATTRIATPPNYDHRIMSQTHGADVASAATIDLDAATGDLVDVTGITTITAITLSDGRFATARFTGALTLTNGASLVLPGAANITTAAGDFAIFRGYAASVVRCVSYVKADGTPVIKDGTTITLGTEQASNAGTSIDFTSIPSWVKRITIAFKEVSTSGTSSIIIQIGDSGGIETTGYLGASGFFDGSSQGSGNITSGCSITSALSAASVFHGRATLTLEDSVENTWIFSSIFGRSDAAFLNLAGFSKSLSAVLDRVRITTFGGTDTFDAGAINIQYE